MGYASYDIICMQLFSLAPLYSAVQVRVSMANRTRSLMNSPFRGKKADVHTVASM